MADRPEVFISYARKDGKPLATWLRRRLELEHPDIRLWQDLTDLEGGQSWWAQIIEALDAVEVMILVLTPGAVASPIVRQEWQHARQRGVRVYPVTGEHGPKPDFQAMPRWMSKAHCYDLDTAWDSFVLHLKGPGRAARVPFMAPDLPKGFVQRPGQYDRLRALLLQGNRKDPVAITTSLIGAGGFGKTTLAAALCHDDEVITAFGDGILWVTLGETPDLLGGLTNLYSALMEDKDHGFRDVEQASKRVANRLKDKDALLVIDDVWKPEHLKPFLSDGAGCARLITTRQLAIADAADCQCVAVDEMSTAEAVQMLREKLVAVPDDLEPLRDLARRLGEWPLLLDLVGAALRLRMRRGDTLSGALDYVRRGLDQKGVAAFQRDGTEQRHQSIARTMQVSLDLLEAEERRRYLELSIFAEDVDIAPGAIRTLWQLDAYDAERQAERLNDLSLLKYDPRAGTVRLHDVVRTHLAEQLGAAVAVHARLVDSWGDSQGLPDAFAWRWYVHHLVEAGRTDRLRELLLDFGWLRAKLDATDVVALGSDFVYLRDDADVRLVQGAIRLSAHHLVRDKAQLPSQLCGRLLAVETPALRRLQEQAIAKTDGPWLRAVTPGLTSPGEALLRTLEGHTDGVHAVAVTPDGRCAVSASDDRTLRVWDLHTGQPLRTLEGHTGWVRAVAVTPDGRCAVSASYDRTLRVWDLHTGQAQRTLEGHFAGVRAVAVTPDGRRVISASYDWTLRDWDLHTGQPLRTLEGHTGWVRAVSVTPDGRRAVSASDDRTLRVWDLTSGQALRTLEGHTAGVLAVSVTPDGRRAISASYDGTLRVWDLHTGQPLRTLEGPTAGVRAVAVTPDGSCALSASTDRTLRVWDLHTGQPLRTLKGHTGGIRAVAATPDGRCAVSASYDRTLRVWDLHTGQPLRTLEGHTGGVLAVAATPDGRRAVSASYDGTLRVWDLTTGQPLRTLEGHTGWVLSVAVTPDGRCAVSASDDRTLRVWDLTTGQPLRTLGGHTDGVLAVAVTPDGRCAVSASDDRTLRVWDLTTGQPLRTLEGHTDGVLAVAVTPDGRCAVSASDDRTLRSWDLHTGKALRTLKGHTAGVRAVAVTPDGRCALSASSDRTLRVWDLRRGQPLATFHGEFPFWSCGVGPDGRTIVGGDESGRVHILRLEGVEETVTPMAPEIKPRGRRRKRRS